MLVELVQGVTHFEKLRLYLQRFFDLGSCFKQFRAIVRVELGQNETHQAFLVRGLPQSEALQDGF